MDSAGQPEHAGPGPDGTELLAEDHWTEEDSPITRLCRTAVGDHPVVRSTAHYSHGALDFVVRPRGSAPLPARDVHGGPLATEGRAGRHLVVCVQDMDRSLRRLGTGELMRVVVGTPAGGMYCARIRGGQHLTGVTLSGTAVRELDRCLNATVRAIRTDVYHLPDENLGGDTDRELTEPEGPAKLHFEVGLRDVDTADEPRLRDLWQRTVNPVDLQYAAYYRDGALTCAGDAFDDPRLGLRLFGMPSGTRRAMYRDLAARLRSDVARLRNALRPAITAPVDRLVLDVQEGAVYLHWPGRGAGTFLLGVTTDQQQVDLAERRLRALLSAVSAAPGAP